MTIADRLSSFLKSKRLTANELSKLINVQRSTLSHILSGRNKPSLDLIERFTEAFPQVDIIWLITGKGEMNFKELKRESAPIELSFTQDEAIKGSKLELIEPVIEQIESVTSNEKPTEAPIVSPAEKKAIKTIIFYDNGSFDIFHNSLL